MSISPVLFPITKPVTNLTLSPPTTRIQSITRFSFSLPARLLISHNIRPSRHSPLINILSAGSPDTASPDNTTVGPAGVATTDNISETPEGATDESDGLADLFSCLPVKPSSGLFEVLDGGHFSCLPGFPSDSVDGGHFSLLFLREVGEIKSDVGDVKDELDDLKKRVSAMERLLSRTLKIL